MNGRTSIKVVLPALVPELSYGDLAVQEGDSASRLFLQLVTGRYAGDAQQLRRDLLAYCALDTLAMVKVLGCWRRRRGGEGGARSRGEGAEGVERAEGAVGPHRGAEGAGARAMVQGPRKKGQGRRTKNQGRLRQRLRRAKDLNPSPPASLARGLRPA